MVHAASAWRVAVCGGVLLLVAVAVGRGQPPAPKTPAKDPTQPDPDVRSKFDPPRGPQAEPGQPDFPVILLKGRLVTAGMTPAALLEIDGRLFTVRKDASIEYGGRNAFRVVDISPAGVHLEFPARKKTLVLQ